MAHSNDNASTHPLCRAPVTQNSMHNITRRALSSHTLVIRLSAIFVESERKQHATTASQTTQKRKFALSPLSKHVEVFLEVSKRSSLRSASSIPEIERTPASWLDHLHFTHCKNHLDWNAPHTPCCNTQSEAKMKILLVSNALKKCHLSRWRKYCSKRYNLDEFALMQLIFAAKHSN